MLDDWNDLDLTEVKEQFIKLLLCGAVQDQIGPEYKDSSRQDGKNVQTFIAQYAVEQEEDLVYFQNANESEEDPLEGSLEWVDAKLIHVEADFRLIHLQQVFKEFAQGDDRARLRIQRHQLAVVLAEEGSKDEVALLFRVTDVAEGSHIV